MNHTHSEVLNYVSRNFHKVSQDPDIGMLQPHELKLILKHKYLNVEHEDQVLRAVVLWANSRLTQAKDIEELGDQDE